MHKFYSSIDCFEKIPYNGPTVKFDDPITKKKKVSEAQKQAAKECQLLCQQQLHCKYFTWIGSHSKCFLKSSKDGSLDAAVLGGELDVYKKKYSKVLSGPKYCGTGNMLQ